jgi:hypothetical protein
MLISTALLLDSIIRNSVCTPAKLPCRRVEVGYDIMFNRHIIIEHVCFQQRVSLDICFKIGIASYLIFNVKHCKEKNRKIFCL